MTLTTMMAQMHWRPKSLTPLMALTALTSLAAMTAQMHWRPNAPHCPNGPNDSNVPKNKCSLRHVSVKYKRGHSAKGWPLCFNY